MGNLEITPRLIGSLGEVYYKEYCEQIGGWTYTSLEQIHKNGFKNGHIEFKLGFQRYQIKIPDEIKNEILVISKPRYIRANNPSFVFDFLACKLREGDETLSEINDRKIDDFSWVEVKTSGGKVSENQLETANKVQIPVTFCVIYNVKSAPYKVGVKFYYKYLPTHLFDDE